MTQLNFWKDSKDIDTKIDSGKKIRKDFVTCSKCNRDYTVSEFSVIGICPYCSETKRVHQETDIN